MLSLRHCTASFLAVLKRLKATMTEGKISKLYLKFQDDIAALHDKVEDKDEHLADLLSSLLEDFANITMKKGWERDGFSNWGELPMGKSEAELTKEAKQHATAALKRYGELGMEEPNRLVEIFNHLIRRYNEIDPDQSQSLPR
jgi:hypothetical protein